MKIASLVVRAKAANFPALKAALARIPGVLVQHEAPETGHLIVTVEDGEGYAVSDSIVAVNVAPDVLGVTLAYEYSDGGDGTVESLECKEV